MAKRFEHLVCYSVGDWMTFANGQWLGADIPEAKRKKEDVKTAPIIWEYLNHAGSEGWELVAVIESSAGQGQFVRTYYLKREAE